MTTIFRRRPGVTGALTGVIAAALLAGCGTPDAADAGSATPAVPATSPAAPPATTSSETTPAASPKTTPTDAPDETAATQPSTGNNAADVSFARQLIPHHLQAVQLAELAQTRAGDPWVRERAEKIRSARDADIRTLKDWLDMWGAEPLPRGHEMPGMYAEAEVEALAKLSGSRFDKKFVTMMIEHDKGAIRLAGTERAKGAFDGAKALATAVATGLGAEVKELKKYLALLK